MNVMMGGGGILIGAREVANFALRMVNINKLTEESDYFLLYLLYYDPI
jgi:hypothetical protein